MNLRDRVSAFMNPNARILTADPQRQSFVAQRGLRRGMWVMADASTVGILVGLRADGTALIQLVEADGTNRMTLERQPNGEQKLVNYVKPVTAESVRVAFVEQIPAPRRPPPDIAARFGYRSNGK